MVSYHQETTMLREIQEPDRETVLESEIPTEPCQRAISLTSADADSTCEAVQELFAFHSVLPVEPTKQACYQQIDSRSHQSCGSRGESGTMYTISSPDVLLEYLEEAARIQDGFVSLLVHDEHGWHELFLNRSCTQTHSITASYVRDIVANNDLDLWMQSNSTCAVSEDKYKIGEIDGYQLFVYNQR
jgi:hypothetical protein